MYNLLCATYDFPEKFIFRYVKHSFFVSCLYALWHIYSPKTLSNHQSAKGYLQKIVGHSDQTEIFLFRY